MKESNIETILLNPNIATIQTSHQMASEVYCEPFPNARYRRHLLTEPRTTQSFPSPPNT